MFYTLNQCGTLQVVSYQCLAHDLVRLNQEGLMIITVVIGLPLDGTVTLGPRKNIENATGVKNVMTTVRDDKEVEVEVEIRRERIGKLPRLIFQNKMLVNVTTSIAVGEKDLWKESREKQKRNVKKKRSS